MAKSKKTPKQDKWKDSKWREKLAFRVGAKEFEKLRLEHVKKVYG